MTSKLFVKLILSLFIVLNAQTSYGQADENIEMLVNDTKSDLLIVVGGGLAGAVLGLSTLSFVEEPKEHTRNIIVGASIGIIAGVVVVAMSQATKTQNLMYPDGDEYGRLDDQKSFGTGMRGLWHGQEYGSQVALIQSPYSVGFNLNF